MGLRYFASLASWLFLIYAGSIAGTYAYEGGLVPAGHSVPLFFLCIALTLCAAIVERLGIMFVDWLITCLKKNKPR